MVHIKYILKSRRETCRKGAKDVKLTVSFVHCIKIVLNRILSQHGAYYIHQYAFHTRSLSFAKHQAFFFSSSTAVYGSHNIFCLFSTPWCMVSILFQLLHIPDDVMSNAYIKTSFNLMTTMLTTVFFSFIFIITFHRRCRLITTTTTTIFFFVYLRQRWELSRAHT